MITKYPDKFPDIYCPDCGTPIHDPDSFPSCPHVVFSYITELGDFDYVAPRMQAQIDPIR